MNLQKLQEYIEIKELLDRKDWWTVEELAAYLNKDPKTIRNHYIGGKTPPIDIAGCSKKVNGIIYIMKDLFKEQFLNLKIGGREKRKLE